MPIKNVTDDGLARRIYDLVAEINGVKKYVDAKGWDPDNIEEFIRLSLTSTKKAGKDFDGQLYRDIIRMYNNGNWKFDVSWAFDARSLNRGLETRIPDLISDTIESNSKLLGRLMRDLNIDLLNDFVRRDFLNTLRNGLNDFIMVVE